MEAVKARDRSGEEAASGAPEGVPEAAAVAGVRAWSLRKVASAETGGFGRRARGLRRQSTLRIFPEGGGEGMGAFGWCFVRWPKVTEDGPRAFLVFGLRVRWWPKVTRVGFGCVSCCLQLLSFVTSCSVRTNGANCRSKKTRQMGTGTLRTAETLRTLCLG